MLSSVAALQSARRTSFMICRQRRICGSGEWSLKSRSPSDLQVPGCRGDGICSAGAGGLPCIHATPRPNKETQTRLPAPSPKQHRAPSWCQRGQWLQAREPGVEPSKSAESQHVLRQHCLFGPFRGMGKDSRAQPR